MKKLLRLNWESYLPGNGTSSSPNFEFGGKSFCMRRKTHDGVTSLNITGLENYATPSFCNVIVELKDTNGVSMPCSQSNNIDIRNCCILRGNWISENRLMFIVELEETDASTAELDRKLDEKYVQTSSEINSGPCLESLSEDFSKLLDGSSDPDVEFQCGDYTAKAHKIILCTRSMVFASMLNSDMAEGRTGLVKIQDMTSDIFQQFLRYLYTGRLDKLTVESAICLYEAGDKYAVKWLTRRCAIFLTENLTEENACEVLAVLHAHSDQTFTEAVITYILAKNIPLQDHWSTFCETHPQLAIEVLNRFYKLCRSDRLE